jgi:hypothetical protein
MPSKSKAIPHQETNLHISNFITVCSISRSREGSLTTVTIIFNWYSGGWSPVGSTQHCAATNSLIVPALGDYDDGEIGGMMIGMGNRSNWRKPAPVPLCPPQPHMPAWTQTQAAAVAS